MNEQERNEMNHQELAKICLEASCKAAGIDPALVMETKNNDRVFARQVAMWAMDKVGVPKLEIQKIMRCSPDNVRYSRMIARDRMHTSARDANQCQGVMDIVIKAIETPRKYKLTKDPATCRIVASWQTADPYLDRVEVVCYDIAEDLVNAGLAEWTETKVKTKKKGKTE